jgi:hypothetical protein
MKKVMLLFGYSDTKKKKSLFEFSMKCHQRTFGEDGFDIILHCWNDDPFKDTYISTLKPKHTILDEQRNVPKNLRMPKAPNVGPRVHALLRLYKVLKTCQYDLCFLRRFDLIFHIKFDFDSIDLDKIHIERAYTKRNGYWEIKKPEHSSSFGKRRQNDTFLISNYENMLNFLNFDPTELNISMQSNRLKQREVYKPDFHYVFGQRILDLKLFDKINYIIDEPLGCEITRRYFERIKAAFHSEKKEWKIK